MALFPKLKTTAVTQFPSGRSLSYATEVLRFVDGSEQRFRRAGAPVLRWEISLSKLDGRELAAVREFFLSQQGRYGTFEFMDPWDGTEHHGCSFEGDELELTLDGERSSSTKMTIRRGIA
jgi:hypothetical protein